MTVGTFVEDIEEPSADLVRSRGGSRSAAVRNNYLFSPQAWKKQFRCRKRDHTKWFSPQQNELDVRGRFFEYVRAEADLAV